MVLYFHTLYGTKTTKLLDVTRIYEVIQYTKHQNYITTEANDTIDFTDLVCMGLKCAKKNNNKNR